jgi:hypothetical protein
MSAIFYDLQDETNPDNGKIVEDGASVKELLRKNALRRPFTCQLVYEDRLQLMIGLGEHHCSAQHSANNGDSQYLVGYLRENRGQTGEVEFMLSGSPTEISRRHCFPLDILLEVAAHFVETGDRSSIVLWEEA